MNLSDFSTIVSLLVLVITWLIVQPLKTSIAALQASVERLTAVMEETRKAVAGNDEELARRGEQIRTLFSRVEHIESKCERCHCRGGE